MNMTITRNCFITGATNGIGKETAIALATQGFHLTLMVRDRNKGEAVSKEITQKTGNTNIALLVGDLASLADVRRVANDFLATGKPLHLLVNNAGLINMKHETTADGFEGMFGVNHLGHFLLTLLLLPRLKSAAPTRIVVVASDAHRFVKGLDFHDLQWKARPFQAMKVYGASKLCNIYFARELARRLEGSGVTVNALHPGWVGTGLGANNGMLGKVITFLQKPFARSPRKGAESSIYVATSPTLEGVSGNYYFNCREHRPSRAACDAAAAKQLWVESEKLCGVVAV